MRRGDSGLSFVVGIDKPAGITSHDVVNRCRRIFGERRIGHTGTLDPSASGAMAVCVGPATKLSTFLTAHDKEYAARMVFGTATDTDDAEGRIVRSAPVPPWIADADRAAREVAALVGKREQMPPAYSAIKVDGRKSYEAARRGVAVELAPRPVEVYSAALLGTGRGDDGSPFWDVRLKVSAGTYIRSVARDLGVSLGTCAHLGMLRRLRSGRLAVGDCVSLERLEADPRDGRLDPVALLGCRYLSAQEASQRKAVLNGGRLWAADLGLYELAAADGAESPRSTRAVPSPGPLRAGELVAVLVDNSLAALYSYDGDGGCLKSRCGFAQGVSRGIV